MLADRPDYFQLSYEVTGILSEDVPTGHAMLLVLQKLAQAMDFDFAAFWMVDDRDNQLHCNVIWRSLFIPENSDFERVCRVRAFHLNESHLGTVWMQRKTRWVADLYADPMFARSSVAASAGLISGVAFAVATNSGAIGVIELLSSRLVPPDPTTERFLAALGGQIAVFLERARVRAELLELNTQFLRVASASSETIVTIDAESKFVFVNAAMEPLLGYKPEELIGKSLSQIIPERLREAHQRGLDRYMATGVRNIRWDGIALPALHRDGTEVPLIIAFGEFTRQGKRVFTGFLSRAEAAHLI